MRKSSVFLGLLWISCSLIYAQPRPGGGQAGGPSAPPTIWSAIGNAGATLPSTCGLTSGLRLFYKTDGGLYTCSAANTWTLTSGGLSGSGAANQVAYWTSGSALGGLTAGNNAVLITSGTGVPSISSTIPSATQDNITRTGTLVAGATGTGFTVALGASTITGTLGSANGGTGNGFTKFSGPTTSEKIFTLPDASSSLAVTSNNLSVFAATTSAQLAGVMSDETGSGLLTFATSPTLTTPNIGVATATSLNKVAITAPVTSATLTIADGKTLTASNTLTFTGTDASSVAFGTGGTVAYTANNLGAFAATTSAQLAGVIGDETGSGALTFATSPSFTTQISTPSIVTASGALGITPAAGSNLNVTLSTTGDFAVNTNQLYVDTSAARVSIGMSAPGNRFVVNVGTGDGIVVHDGTNNDVLISNQGGFGVAQFYNAGVIKAQINASGDSYFTGGDVRFGTDSTTTGVVRFANSASPNLTSIQAGNASAAVTYTLPTADGSNGHPLTTNGAGALSWAGSFTLVKGLQAAVATKTAAYTITTSDFFILANATTAAFTVTLPAASTTGMIVHIEKSDSSANAVTVSRAGADTIEGATTISLASQYSATTLIAGGGSVWYKLSAVQ